LAELIIGVALLGSATAWWGAFGAVALQIFITAGIAGALARGKELSCRCFGRLGAVLSGLPTLLRSETLAAAAAFMLWQGWHDVGPDAWAWAATLDAGGLATVVASVSLLVLCIVVPEHLAHLIEAAWVEAAPRDARATASSADAGGGAASIPGFRTAGLPVGAPAPGFDSRGRDSVAHEALRLHGRPALLSFETPTAPCRTVLSSIAERLGDCGQALTLVVISTAAPRNATGRCHESQDADAAAWIAHAYGVEAFPSAVLVTKDGFIASRLALGHRAIAALAGRAVLPDSSANENFLPSWPSFRSPSRATADGRPELTIGMATYDDFDGVYFTLQAMRLYHDLADTELLVIDNYGCRSTREFVEQWSEARYVLSTDVTGTAAPRDLVFREARGEAVLCCDCHVLFVPGAIARLRAFYRQHPDCIDLLQGPLLYDDGRLVATHLDPQWRDGMWGTWAMHPRGADPEAPPFEIPMQGLGAFSCRKEAWLGFNDEVRGFGGEEGYIHEKFRLAGRRCLCLPWLRWMHRFGRPSGPRFPLSFRDRIRNYFLGHAELGLDVRPIVEHFSAFVPKSEVIALAEEALSIKWAGS
jgi:hypothetical protein